MRYDIVTYEKWHEVDFEPDLVIGFYQDIKEATFKIYYEKIKEKFPDTDFVACSTESNIYNQIPYVDMDEEHRCVYLFLELDKNAYDIRIVDTSGKLTAKTNEKRYDAIVLSSGYSKFLDDDISILKSAFDIDNLFGALAGVSEPENTPQVFCNGRFYDNSMILLMFDKTVYEISGLSVHQFEPVGFEMNITRAQGARVYELDNRSALDVLDEAIGTITHKKIQSFSFPFFLKKSGIHSFDKSPLASIKDFDREQKTITLYRYVKEQDKLKLSIPLSSQEQIQRLKRFHGINKGNTIAFIFNCVGIKFYLGMMEYVYLMDLKRQLDVPFIGFHSFGEIGSVDINGETILHNQTISLAALSCREDKK